MGRIRALFVIFAVVAGVNSLGFPAAATASSVSSVSSNSQPQDVAPSDWLGEINKYRSAANLAPVSDQPAWDTGLAHHLTYLAKTPPSYFTGQYQSAHTENPQSPYYTPDGAQEASASDLLEGHVGLTPVDIIDDWLTAPFHAIGMLRANLTQVAFVYDPTTGDAGLDVLTGLDQTQPAATSPVLFPGPGVSTTLVAFSGENPNPLETCGWSAIPSVGLPLVLLLPQDPDPALAARLVTPSGAAEDSANGQLCIVDDHTYYSSDPVYGPAGAQILEDDHAVILIPKSRLGSGTYTATVSQPNQADITWSFSVPVMPGAWTAEDDGTVNASGAVSPLGSPPGNLAHPVVGMAATPDGAGYWLVASDGGIFSFGDAKFYGSTGAIRLNKPIVGMAATPDGAGYWLVASDGGIFSFGDAAFYGSTGAMRLAQPIVGMAATPDGAGYWLVASDGGIFSFGDAPFLGSAAGATTSMVTGMAGAPSAVGYELVGADGSTYPFGQGVPAASGPVGGAYVVGIAVVH